MMTTNTRGGLEFIAAMPLRVVDGYVEGMRDFYLKDAVAIKGQEREVAALKGYKQRLIADVVTGQRRVA